MNDWSGELEKRKQQVLKEKKDQARREIARLKNEQRAHLALQKTILRHIKTAHMEDSLEEFMQHAVFGNPKYGNPSLLRSLFFAKDKREDELWPPPAKPLPVAALVQSPNLQGKFLHRVRWELGLNQQKQHLSGIRVELDALELRVNGQLVNPVEKKLFQKALLFALDHLIELT